MATHSTSKQRMVSRRFAVIKLAPDEKTRRYSEETPSSDLGGYLLLLVMVLTFGPGLCAGRILASSRQLHPIAAVYGRYEHF